MSLTDTDTTDRFAHVEAAVRALRAGRMAVVRDDAGRENEGDLVLAAARATPGALAVMARLGGGLICAPITADQAEALDLVPVSPTNTTPTGTAFLTPIDVIGSTTGISTAERAATARALADPATVAGDLQRPGHLLPLRAHEGGVRARGGTPRRRSTWRGWRVWPRRGSFARSWGRTARRCGERRWRRSPRGTPCRCWTSPTSSPTWRRATAPCAA